MSADSLSTFHLTERNYLMSLEDEAHRMRRRQTQEDLQEIHNELTDGASARSGDTLSQLSDRPR